MIDAQNATLSCDLFIAIGSSLQVYPAAGFPILAKRNGSNLIILNREQTDLDDYADLVLNYEETKKTIEKFLGLSDDDHTYKFKFFNPSESSKNVMIWKKFSNQNAIKRIKNDINYFEFKDF